MPASANRRRTGPRGQTIASAVLASQQRPGAQYQAKAAGIEKLELAEVKDDAPAVSRITASSAGSRTGTASRSISPRTAIWPAPRLRCQ